MDPSVSPVERFTMAHFSQSNPVGAGQRDVPALLRRVADTIDRLGDVEVHNLVMDPPLDPDEADGPPSITVYYQVREGAGDDES